MRRVLPTLLAVAAVLAGLLTAAQQTHGGHERAREAVERGEILPLEDILARARAEFAGEMLAVELEEERHDGFDAALVYEVKMLADDGAVTELYYDARTGDLLKARGHGLEQHHREDGAQEDRDDHEDEHDEDDDGWGWFRD